MAISTTDFGGPDPYDPPDPNDPYAWEPRRRVLPWIAAVVAVVLVAVAVVVASGSSDEPTTVSSKARRDGPIAMPSVLTFKMPEAIALLAKEGIDASQIQIRRVPRQSVGPGTVLEQIPRAGMTVAEGVMLVASRRPDTMPDFVGKGVNAARATFSILKVKLTVEDALDASVSDGTVLAQTPAGGAPFANAVQLTVARKPIPSNLGDFNGVGTAPTKADEATIAGTAYRDSLTWTVSVCPGAPPVSVSYLLAGRYRKLVATAGLSAGAADPADRVRLDIAVDGTVVVSEDLDGQSPRPIDIDLVGRQQLALTFTPIAGGDPQCANAPATLGHARLLSIAQSR